jgi:hypothetical protein
MTQAGFPFEWALGAVFSAVVYALFNPLFWIVLILVALQYRRIAQLREEFFGARGSSVLVDILVATAYGFFGGLIGGYLIVLAGLTISGSGLWYLLPVAVLLMFINPRFLCFAYGGGLLAVCHLLFGFPEISIPQIMALVAILHFVESILIRVSGHLGAVPAFIRLPQGRVVGGFTLQKFWPIPVVVLAVVSGSAVPGMDLVPMPEWWPLIKPEVPGDPSTMVFAMLTLVAGLGYADIATTRTPRDKSRISSVYLAGYSVVLFVLAVLAASGGGYAWAAALFAPLGHELIIHISKHMELNGRPLFIPHPDGVMVLDVLEKTPAWRAGLRSGDIILEINDQQVHNRADLHLLLGQPGLKEINYLHREKRFRRETVSMQPGDFFGVMSVPEGTEQLYLELQNTSPLMRWLRRGRSM